ncbi:MAG: acylphosphatase [Bacteroidetes bacterium]|nr:acylphosphatase [Bacteroidota bacterium]
MAKEYIRAEIIVTGLVQGVGFRYFVYSQATALGLKGITKNLFTGEVFTIAEGEKAKVEELCKKIRIGPSHAHVRGFNVHRKEVTNEFSTFEIDY